MDKAFNGALLASLILFFTGWFAHVAYCFFRKKESEIKVIKGEDIARGLKEVKPWEPPDLEDVEELH